MTQSGGRVLCLEFDDTERLAGRLSDEAGVATEFLGWIGLATAIDNALEAERLRDAGRLATTLG